MAGRRNEGSGATAAGDERVVIGRISGLYGVKGWVKLFSHTAPRDNLLDYGDVVLGRTDSAGVMRWTPAQRREPCAGTLLKLWCGTEAIRTSIPSPH